MIMRNKNKSASIFPEFHGIFRPGDSMTRNSMEVFVLETPWPGIPWKFSSRRLRGPEFHGSFRPGDSRKETSTEVFVLETPGKKLPRNSGKTEAKH
jgi:hypothetical protein